MKYIIVGLGVFGSSLAEKLASQGNEVIGVDTKMQRVNELKDKITHVACLNVTDARNITLEEYRCGHCLYRRRSRC